MKKFLCSSLTVFLITSVGALAQSTTQKVEEKAGQAVTSVENAAKKTGAAVESAAKKTGAAVQNAAEKTGAAVENAADTTVKGVKKVGSDVVNSAIYKKIETELGKPFTPEQQQKYAEAWKAAQQKVRATEKEFSDKISEITGVEKKKTAAVVKAEGL